jgi:uncharacterized protein YdhG (YjbR/CyaY superfamily)
MTNMASINAYLQRLPDVQRAALMKVRAQIRAAAPGAEEYFGYGMIGFKWQGHPLLYIGAASKHCALYGARTEGALAEQLAGFKQSKGSIQFTPDKPIPARLVTQIVRARMAANEQRWGTQKAPTKTAPAKKKAPAKKYTIKNAR